MTEGEVWSIFFQMVMGLHALHNKKIVHRDIKCANIFLTKRGVVKLGDLNVSKIAKNNVMQTQTGTPYYASPEVWQDKPYDKSSDIWSLGAVLYEMSALSPPFTAKDMKGLYNRVIKGVYPKIPSQYSSDLSSMIASLLQVDPKKRPSTEQILHMPVFIAKYNENKHTSPQGSFGEESRELIGTIRVPKNLSLLAERLPASQYETDKRVGMKVDSAGLGQIIEEEEYVKKPAPTAPVSVGKHEVYKPPESRGRVMSSQGQRSSRGASAGRERSGQKFVNQLGARNQPKPLEQ